MKKKKKKKNNEMDGTIPCIIIVAVSWHCVLVPAKRVGKSIVNRAEKYSKKKYEELSSYLNNR